MSVNTALRRISGTMRKGVTGDAQFELHQLLLW
jgi:hypothetical protein